jgi:TetR/AcrR family transcriptional repressor of nem operon
MGRKSDAKEKLLKVAFELIWDSSYGSVSIDQICHRAGVNKGSFYYFFKTKAELAVTAYEEHWKAQQPEMDRLFSPQVPPLERISRWCEYLCRGQEEKAECDGKVCGCPYASIGIELATQEGEIRAKAEELMARSIKYIESAIADAKREGSAQVGDPKEAAHHVYSFILGTVLQAKICNDLQVLKNLEPTVMTIIGASRTVAA